MKKYLLVIALIMIVLSFTACGDTLNVSAEGDINNNPNGFVYICTNPIDLCYDSMTNIIYIDNAYNVKTPYYAPNGLPYKYNDETNTFEEIDIDK